MRYGTKVSLDPFTEQPDLIRGCPVPTDGEGPAISISPVFTSKLDDYHRGLPVSLCLVYFGPMLPRPGTLPVEFVQPCLPMKAPSAPSGALWLHEIKHDDFHGAAGHMVAHRVLADPKASATTTTSRAGTPLSRRLWPLIAKE
jgi:hypothetical protein